MCVWGCVLLISKGGTIVRVCYISITNMFLCPYFKTYRDITDGIAETDLIYWDRHNENEQIDGISHIHRYCCDMNENESKITKFFNIIGFKNFCETVLKKEKYDKLIFLHNLTGFFLYPFLKKFYAGKYVFDIRDYSYESNPLFYFVEKKLIQQAGLNVVSSGGFKDFLPEADYVILHNDCNLSRDTISRFRMRDVNFEKKQISFIGLVRFFEINQKLMDVFSNEKDFCLAYYGQNATVLKAYAEEHNYGSMDFYDRFPPEKTIEFYEKTDIINNFYGRGLHLDYALSNKLYYAAKLGIPILVCKGTYMERFSREYGFGISIDLSAPDCVNDLRKQYNAFDREMFLSGCDRFITLVTEENKKFKQEMVRFITA